MQNSSLDGGFSNREIDAAYAFRALMNAMAKPGTVADITGASAPAPLSVAASTALLTLCDADTRFISPVNSLIKQLGIGSPSILVHRSHHARMHSLLLAGSRNLCLLTLIPWVQLNILTARRH